MAERVKRRYRSPRREEGAQRTRSRILDAARERFVTSGYAGTSIAAIAGDAGCAAETVYATFRTKPAILEELVRAAARGPEGGEILEQTGPARVAGETDRRERLRLFAQDVTARLQRVGPLLGVLAAAAASEPKLAALYARIHEDRLRNVATLKGADAETIWALASPELYMLLTTVRGWTPERYADWLGETLAAVSPT
jgi:AcrR family transcriptional regulator